MKVNNETKVGTLASIAMVLLILGYNILKGNEIFGNNQTFYAEYENVEGLTSSSMVTYKGLTVGKVKELNANTASNKIRVRLEVKSEHQIPLGSVAKIASGDLLGTKIVELILAKNEQYHVSGDMLTGKKAESIADGVERTIGPLKVKAEELMSSLDTMIKATEVILVLNRENINQSISSVKSTLERISNSAIQVDTLIGQEADLFHETLFSIHSIIKNLDDNNTAIEELLKNSAVISDSLQSADLTKAIDEAAKALAAFSKIAEKIERGEGNIGKLFTDDSLYIRLNNSAASLDTFLAKPELRIKFGNGKKKKKKSMNNKNK